MEPKSNNYDSRYTVGFQDKGVEKFSTITSSFAPIAETAEEKWTLADYKVNCVDALTATKGWKANVDTFNLYTSAGLFDKSFVYIPPTMAAAFEKSYHRTIVPGWYDKTDKTYLNSCNGEEIDFGQGVIAKGSYADAKVTFSGAVKKGPTVTDIAKFTIVGNSSAVPRYLGDIIVNCPDALTSTSGWKANVDTINTYTAQGLFDKAYVYIPPTMAAAFEKSYHRTITPGWYDKTDKTYLNCCNKTRQFAAGEGFIAKGSYADATLTIKSALAEGIVVDNQE